MNLTFDIIKTVETNRTETEVRKESKQISQEGTHITSVIPVHKYFYTDMAIWSENTYVNH